MATVPYVFTVYPDLNTTYTVSSTKNGLKNIRLIQMTIIDTLRLMA